MSDLGEAVGAIGGLFFGGWLFLAIGSQLETMETMNFTVWGMLFILVAIVSLVILVTGILGAAFSR